MLGGDLKMEWDKDDLDALNKCKLELNQMDNEELLSYYSYQVIECESLNKVGTEFCKMVLELRYQYLKLAKGKILERMGGNNND